jgi:hypothetical protein
MRTSFHCAPLLVALWIRTTVAAAQCQSHSFTETFANGWDSAWTQIAGIDHGNITLMPGGGIAMTLFDPTPQSLTLKSKAAWFAPSNFSFVLEAE